MLTIHIKFESSWTNCFSDKSFTPLFDSGTAFNAGQGAVRVQAIPLAKAAPHTSRVENIRALNAANPGMAYQVPADYDNTVRGVLARISGEVRRLKDLEEDHPLRGVFSRMRYEMGLTSEHDEIISFATPPKEIQSGGAGLLPAGSPLYENSVVARKLFGHLGLPLSEMLKDNLPTGDWTPTSPSDLISKLEALKAEQAAWVKRLKAEQGAAYVSPFAAGAEKIAKDLAQKQVSVQDHDTWHWAGARLAHAVHTLPDANRSELIAQGYLSERGNFPGVAMSGKLGNVTIKDLFQGAGCNKAYSTRMPYSANLWFETGGSKKPFDLGVIKKSGELTIHVDVSDELAQDLRDRIDAAGVGVFHFGKKGIAYVERCYIE